MATHVIAAGKVASNAVLLVANTTDSFTFVEDPDYVEVISDGAAELYVTVDGSDPVIGAAVDGTSSRFMPAYPCKRTIAHGRNPADVKVKSDGTPTVYVARV